MSADNDVLNKRYVPVTKARLDVLLERQRQTSEEGWTEEHDDEYTHGELARAATCYAIPKVPAGLNLLSLWPWMPKFWKPKSRRYDLVRAAALLIAEIERIDRETERNAPKCPDGEICHHRCKDGYCFRKAPSVSLTGNNPAEEQGRPVKPHRSGGGDMGRGPTVPWWHGVLNNKGKED